MAKSKPIATSASKAAGPTEALRETLSGRTKKELMDILVQLAKTDRGVLSQLTAHFDVPAAPEELVTTTRLAISGATAFDERQMNRNFSYDLAAYGEVKRNLSRLIDMGHLPQAMELSLELMKKGSHQVEMSDEGLMTEDIEDCLSVVFESLKKCDLPAQKIIAWCSAMLRSDCVQFIATDELKSLRSHLQALAARR